MKSDNAKSMLESSENIAIYKHLFYSFYYHYFFLLRRRKWNPDYWSLLSSCMLTDEDNVEMQNLLQLFCVWSFCDFYYWLTCFKFITIKLRKVKFVNTCQINEKLHNCHTQHKCSKFKLANVMNHRDHKLMASFLYWVGCDDMCLIPAYRISCWTITKMHFFPAFSLVGINFFFLLEFWDEVAYSF